jgi:hypothetical protein
MAILRTFRFTGGVMNFSSAAQVKFLLFLVNGGKEVSLYEGKKYGFVSLAQSDSIFTADPSLFQTEIAVVKIFLMEVGGFGLPKFVQSFYLALGSGLERQEVVIRPRSSEARARKYEFKADARFLKTSEALALLDPESVGYKMLEKSRLYPPPVDVLREIITINRVGQPENARAATHGSQRFLRITK